MQDKPPPHRNYRTKLCRNYANGSCSFGEKCTFIHPAPTSFPLAQHAFTWNALLLPQLLALSNQQAAQKPMIRRSPPRSQGPQLVGEDPSPTTSLLLSRSDCTSPDQVPPTKRSSRRKRYACRNFVRTGGWCPTGGHCKFQHDVATLHSAGQKTNRALPFTSNTHGEGGRLISGGVSLGIQPSSIASRTRSMPQSTTAELMPPFSPIRHPPMNSGVLHGHSDQPVYFSNYPLRPYQPYYPTVPALAIPAGPCSVARQSIYPPPQSAAPPREAQTSLLMGSYEMNGTTYFPAFIPSVSVPHPPASVPVHSIPFNHTVPGPVYPYHAPTSLHAGHYKIHQTSFDPFASDQIKPSELPVTPWLEDYQMSPAQQDVLRLPAPSPSPPSGDQGLTTTSGRPTVVQEYEFPFRPMKEHRVGHARRISVNIKKHVRVKSG